MNKISISEFKATCLKVVEQVRKTGQSITITKNGEPAATLIPPIIQKSERVFGAFKDQLTVEGDIISPFEQGWEVLK